MMALFHNASTADGDMQEFRKNAQECMDQACRKTVEEAEETGKRWDRSVTFSKHHGLYLKCNLFPLFGAKNHPFISLK